jgi:SPP1 family predicted phage head-tail adaptor
MSRIGQLRDRITLSRKIQVSDGFGGWVKTWRDIGTYFGEAKPVTGRAVFFADGLREQEAVLFEFRAGPDMRQGDRLTWRGALHDIEAVSALSGPKRFIEVSARVVQAGEP